MIDSPSHASLDIADHGPVRVLTLNRPQRRNAIDSALAAVLLAALRAADADPSVRAVVLAGAGPAFCAGADLNEFKEERADPVAQERRDRMMLEMLLLFGSLEVTVIAAVTGMAAGLGGAIAVSADLSVMGESARIGYPEIVHGMVPSLMISHLQHRTGRKLAYELLAIGEPWNADKALARGLANLVVPDAQVLEAAMELARKLARHDRSVLRETKRMFVDVAALPLEESTRQAYESSSQRPTLAL